MSSTKKDESTPTQKLGKPANQVTDEEWRKVLPDEVYHVAREAGTERPHTSKYVKHFTPGKYTCYCCGAELFVSDAKFWSSCGWPSFSKSVEGDKNIVRIRDTSFGMERIEVRCKQCNAHLGHVFQNEGVTATEERYCINGCTLDFVPEKKD
ncbi:Peptide-methionine (R)-S-oxide reductase [Aphelenchoides besseyi]|nr:Peptide-methionine (R)-S-oxide reductase [Aphelenchoides besseyi]KAI6202512.1 Peptide-methionine (R)-S-oxide reductase [Aphelenchoides besseyi]